MALDSRDEIPFGGRAAAPRRHADIHRQLERIIKTRAGIPMEHRDCDTRRCFSPGLVYCFRVSAAADTLPGESRGLTGGPARDDPWIRRARSWMHTDKSRGDVSPAREFD
jgi:hypothetical protein